MNTIKTAFLLALLGSVSLSVQAGGDASAGQSLVVERCQSCHGADGNSTDPQFPRLAGQHADYLVRALSEYKSGARSNPIMAGFAAGLTEQDQKNVAVWFSSQTGLITPVEPNTVAH
jgi:cytochrome c553